MIKIQIGSEEHSISEVDEHWIEQQINARRRDGQNVCVRVQLDSADVDMTLSTPSCGSGGGGRRPPTPKERAILELWNKHHLNQVEFSVGDVVAFLRQASKIL